MECGDIHKKLSEYVDDILSPQEKMVIDEHLKACRKCRAALADLKETIEQVKGLETIEPPVWMKQKIMAKVRAEARPKKSLFQKLFYPLHIKLPVGAVATIAIALTTLYVFRTIEPEVRLAKAPSEEVAPPILQREIIKEDKVRPLTKSVEEEPPQEISTAPEKLSEEVVTGKAEMKTDKLAQESVQEPGKKEEAKAAAPAKRVERAPAMGAIAKDEARQEIGATAPGAKLLFMEKKKEEPLILTVFVKDPEAAGKEIEKTLRELEGKAVGVETAEGKTIATGEINASKLKELVVRLKTVGKVKEREVDLQSLKGKVKVEIEIVRISEEQ